MHNTNQKVPMILQFDGHTTASLQLPSPFFSSYVG
jgi:hypothetical protein